MSTTPKSHCDPKGAGYFIRRLLRVKVSALEDVSCQQAIARDIIRGSIDFPGSQDILALVAERFARLVQSPGTSTTNGNQHNSMFVRELNQLCWNCFAQEEEEGKEQENHGIEKREHELEAVANFWGQLYRRGITSDECISKALQTLLAEESNISKITLALRFLGVIKDSYFANEEHRAKVQQRLIQIRKHLSFRVQQKGREFTESKSRHAATGGNRPTFILHIYLRWLLTLTQQREDILEQLYFWLNVEHMVPQERVKYRYVEDIAQSMSENSTATRLSWKRSSLKVSQPVEFGTFKTRVPYCTGTLTIAPSPLTTHPEDFSCVARLTSLSLHGAAAVTDGTFRNLGALQSLHLLGVAEDFMTKLLAT